MTSTFKDPRGSKRCQMTKQNTPSQAEERPYRTWEGEFLHRTYKDNALLCSTHCIHQAKSRIKPAETPVVLKLPCLLFLLYAPKYREMSEDELRRACVDVCQHRLSISREEAAYLEESTRLQSQSQLWFEHRVDRITASKFASVSKACTNLPPISLIMAESHLVSSRVPALDWGISKGSISPAG